ncbi:hypothetical protein FHS20_005198 [Phyllobacterium endophyticum]|nr:hypothetical protein [Phyllobacterium endophyticum]
MGKDDADAVERAKKTTSDRLIEPFRALPRMPSGTPMHMLVKDRLDTVADDSG